MKKLLFLFILFLSSINLHAQDSNADVLKYTYVFKTSEEYNYETFKLFLNKVRPIFLMNGIIDLKTNSITIKSNQYLTEDKLSKYLKNLDIELKTFNRYE